MKYFDAFWAHEMIDSPVVMVQAPKDNMEYVPVPPYLSGTHDGNLEGILKQMDANCASTLLWLGDWDFDAVKAHYRELNPVGLAFSLKAKSQKEADEIIEWFKRNT